MTPFPSRDSCYQFPWGPLQPTDPSFYPYWDLWNPYGSRLDLQESYSLLSHQPVPLVYEEEEVEVDLQVPMVLTGTSASSPDKAITHSPSLPDDHPQYQELLQKVAIDLQIPLEEIQDPHRRLLASFGLGTE